MTKSFFKSRNSKFFEGKTAIMLKQIQNNGGQIIEKGEIVTLGPKYRGFRITSRKGISISQVPFTDLNFIP